MVIYALLAVETNTRYPRHFSTAIQTQNSQKHSQEYPPHIVVPSCPALVVDVSFCMAPASLLTLPEGTLRSNDEDVSPPVTPVRSAEDSETGGIKSPAREK